MEEIKYRVMVTDTEKCQKQRYVKHCYECCRFGYCFFGEIPHWDDLQVYALWGAAVREALKDLFYGGPWKIDTNKATALMFIARSEFFEKFGIDRKYVVEAYARERKKPKWKTVLILEEIEKRLKKSH